MHQSEELWRSRRALSAEVGNTFQDLHNSLQEVKNTEQMSKVITVSSERFQVTRGILQVF